MQGPAQPSTPADSPSATCCNTPSTSVTRCRLTNTHASNTRTQAQPHARTPTPATRHSSTARRQTSMTAYCSASPGGGSQGPIEQSDEPGPLSMAALGVALPAATHKHPAFRFWLDEVLWSQGYPSVELLDQVLVESGGQRTGGPARPTTLSRNVRLPLGCEQPRQWDLLWTKSTYALKCVRGLRRGQTVSVVVGLNCLTMKKRMLQTLKAAYGPEAAACLTPLSFALPEELEEWKQHLAKSGNNGMMDQGSQNRQHDLWMLKTGQDAGRGLRLLPATEALAVAEQEARALEAGDTPKHPLQVAQRYVSQPLLLEGRKFHLRLWVLVTRHDPLEAYLHRRGLVLFSSELYQETQPWVPAPANLESSAQHQSQEQQQQPPTSQQPQVEHSQPGQQQRPAASQSPPSQPAASQSPPSQSTASQPAASQSPPSQSPASPSSVSHSPASHNIAPGHITNLACNSSGLVWRLCQLEATLGSQRWAGLWAAMQRSLRLALRAAWGPMQEAHAWLRPPFPEYGYQLVGVDFLVDRDLRPWLLEFNSSPSIMALHDDPATAALIHDEKTSMLRDMFATIANRVYPPGHGPQDRAGRDEGSSGSSLYAAQQEKGGDRGAVGDWVVLSGGTQAL